MIQTFGSISGAHFNPAVSLVELLSKRMTMRELCSYSIVQIFGGICGVLITHLMFGQELIQFSAHDRSDFRFLTSEFIATFGLIMVIALSGKRNVEATPAAVALFRTSAYWCTSSTSFANPAVMIARSFTNTFSGIQWNGAPGFLAAQISGAILAAYVSRFLSNKNSS